MGKRRSPKPQTWGRFLLGVPCERCDMMELKIEYVPIDSIKPYKGNAKKHPKKQIEQIKQSIIAMKDADGDLLTGFKNPLGVWHNEIATGHGRYIAAKELGLETIPIIRLGSMTDEQRRAYIMIDNQLTLNTENDLKQLAIELESIKSIDMPAFSLDLPEIRLQLDALATADDFTIDDINEVDGYDEHNDDREYFEKTFTFPIAKKKQIVCYLKKHYDEVINRIIHDEEEGY